MKLKIGIYFSILILVFFIGLISYQTIQINRLSRRLVEVNYKKETLESQARQLKFNYLSLKEEMDNLKKIFLVENTLDNSETKPKSSQNYQIIWTKKEDLTFDNKKPSDITQKSILRIKNYIKEKETEINDLRTKLDNLNSLLNIREKEIAELKTDNIKLKDELDQSINRTEKIKLDLEGQINSLKLEIARKEEDLKNLVQKNTELNKQIEGLNSKIAELEVETKRQTQRAENLEQELKFNLQSLNNINQEKDTLLNQISELKNRILSLETQQTGLISEKSLLENKLKSLESIQKDNLFQIKNLSIQLEEKQNQILSLHNEIDSLKRKNNELEKEKNTLLDKLSSYQEQLNEKDKLIEEISFYQKQIQELKKSKEELSEEFNKLKNKSSADEKRIKELEEKLKESGYADASSKSLIVKLNNTIKEKDAEIMKLREQIMKLESSQGGLREQALADTDITKIQEKLSLLYDNLSKALEDLELMTWDEVMDKEEIRSTIKSMQKILEEINPEKAE